MTEQHALFTDPHWSEAFSAGDRVHSTYTGNLGVVDAVVPGRHLLIRWAGTSRWEPSVIRHSSPLGLERET